MGRRWTQRRRAFADARSAPSQGRNGVTIVVHIRAWSPGGFCEDHWFPLDQFYSVVRALLDRGYRVVEVSRD